MWEGKIRYSPFWTTNLAGKIPLSPYKPQNTKYSTEINLHENKNVKLKENPLRANSGWPLALKAKVVRLFLCKSSV